MLVIEQEYMNTVIRELPKISKALNEIAQSKNKSEMKQEKDDNKKAEEYWSKQIRYIAKENNIRISDNTVSDVVDDILYHDDQLWEEINKRILAYID